LSGPTRRNIPDCFSLLRACHSTPLHVEDRVENGLPQRSLRHHSSVSWN
jgi:hypothetical protein